RAREKNLLNYRVGGRSGGRGGYIGNEGTRERLPQALIVREVKCFILDDRSTERCAKLMTMIWWRARSDVEWVARVEYVISIELATAAVEPVRARFKEQVYHAARSLAVLGTLVGSKNLGLLH